MGLQPKFDVLEITNCGKSLAVDYSGTIFTNFGARTITVLIAFPSKILTTFGDSRANFSNSSEEISGETSNLALNFPDTCTTHTTESLTKSFGSTCGHPAFETSSLWPRISHISSDVYGANKDKIMVIASTASQTA